MDDKVKAVNKQLRKHCQSSGSMTLIQHTNISFADLNREGVHPNNEGNSKFFKNFVSIFLIGQRMEMYFP